MQEAQEQELQLPEQQLHEQGDMVMVMVVGWLFEKSRSCSLEKRVVKCDEEKKKRMREGETALLYLFLTTK